MNTPRPERNVAPRMAPASLTSEKTKKSAAIKKKGAMAPNVNGAKKKLKFHLDLADHVEAGPSIGPKTAERFEKIGIVTVTEFLKQTAESMATKINYKRITADLIRNWQHQARLVCRIPNLRGHDSQLLVACGITEPEELSTMQPQNLYEIIGPFSDTKEGMKIIRNGKKPDLAEITDWISWAEQTRSLQAA
jgi:predicted flap endonuclease-1-like 5' DNA nuclease